MNSELKQTETLVNKIKKLDPVMYEHVIGRMKAIEKIGNAWIAASDEMEEEILHQQYVLTESQIKSEILDLLKDDSIKREDIDLTAIYRRLL